MASIEPVHEVKGCDHCSHPLYAATRCRVCGRVTEPTTEEPSAVEPVQEPKPVAWRFEARHIDSAWAAAVTLKHPGPEGVYMRNVMPLYAHPPQRKPVEWDGRCMLGHCNSPAGCENSGECRAVERAHGIGGQP